MWEASTKTSEIVGTSAMGAGTALDRFINVTPSNSTMTGFRLKFQVDLGAGAGTYNSFGVGQVAIYPPWSVALSFIPSGDAVPNLATAPDDPHFIFVDHFSPLNGRQTIDTAHGNAYQDLYSWSGIRKGRMQIRSAVTGAFRWHIWNMDTITHTTDWRVVARFTTNPF